MLNTAVITGEIEERKLPSGASEIISKDHPDLPDEAVDAVIERTRELMAS